MGHAMRNRLQHMLTAKNRSAQSDQVFAVCKHNHQILTTEGFNGKPMPGFAHLQDDVTPYILCMHEGLLASTLPK